MKLAHTVVYSCTVGRVAMRFLFSYYGKENQDTEEYLWENTLSVWVGTACLVLNVVVRFIADDPYTVLEWTRPFSEIVCVAGTMMTVMVATRFPNAVPLWMHSLSFVGHLAVGASVYGAPFNFKGVAACSVVLFSALAMYWTLESLVGGAWPYPLSPLEVAALCASLLAIRAV